MTAGMIQKWTVTMMTVIALSIVAVTATPTTDTTEGAFDYAFRFASAIKSDIKDMGRAQEAVVLDIARSGDLDRAISLAKQVAGWRKGAVYADLASMLADNGQNDEAIMMVARAESFNEEIEGWQHTRIEAHIAQAHAKLGQESQARKIATRLNEGDSRQYAGRSVATVAVAHAKNGNFASAMESLGTLSVKKDFDVVWWRTVGYLLLAQEESLDQPLRYQALDEARVALNQIDGWKQIDALILVAEENRKQQRPRQANEALGLANDQAMNLADTMPVKATILSRLAKEWFHQGNPLEARKLLANAESSVPKTMIIDHPALYAQIAAGWSVVGAEEQASRLFDLAFSSAEALENSRPRALALVEVCRTIAQNEVELSATTTARLDSIYASLGDPW